MHKKWSELETFCNLLSNTVHAYRNTVLKMLLEMYRETSIKVRTDVFCINLSDVNIDNHDWRF